MLLVGVSVIDFDGADDGKLVVLAVGLGDKITDGYPVGITDGINDLVFDGIFDGKEDLLSIRSKEGTCEVYFVG